MSNKKNNHAHEIIETVLSLMKKQVKAEQHTILESFIRKYFRKTANEDLLERELTNLYGAVLAHWNLAYGHRSGGHQVNIYNPEFEKHGWQSTHTVVEIVVDDKPFLVDSLRMALNARNLTIHLVIHPVLNIQRNNNAEIMGILEHGEKAANAREEALIHIEVDRITEKETLEAIQQDIESVLQKVSVAVQDWEPMFDQFKRVIDDVKSNPPSMIDKDELEQSLAFLEWLSDNHFTFLGFREYQLTKENELISLGDSGLGLLRSSGSNHASQSFANLPLEIRRLAREPHLLVITKSGRRSTIHRPGYLDHIGIKRFDQQGNVIGERRFMGLYTSAAYNHQPSSIPLLRGKIAYVMERAGHQQGSHASKTLLNILEVFPRDLLFQIPHQELYESAMGILHLQERQRMRLFIHRDRYRRFYSCMMYVPKELYNTTVRNRILSILMENLDGYDSEFDVYLSESILARLYFVLHVPTDSITEYDVAEIEEQIKAATRNWSDDLHDALLESFGEEQGMKLFRRYGDAFRSEYCEHYPVPTAIADIRHMETLNEDAEQLAMSLYRPLESANGSLRFKLFHINSPVSLSDVLPMLENMGLRVEQEHPHKILRAGATMVRLHDFNMSYEGKRQIDIEEIREKFQDTFARVWHGEVENDGFNRLVLSARLDWREIVILRAYSHFLHQAGTPFSGEYMERALSFNRDITSLLIKLFHSRFDPLQQNQSAKLCDTLIEDIEVSLDKVESLDEDRILRNFLNLILATIRTNHYQTQKDGQPKLYVSFKFDPSKIPDLPEPRPMFEIFVYSPRVEGVHLRGGPVARGGLRWSDRREDFRTEVLGLVKAQIVKNAVIVPVGSKGGFFPKQLSFLGDREAFQAEGIACYKTFIRGLLDITDNIIGGKIVTPPQVVRYDGDDPYLVVAADKGTATFSDIANSISHEYNFWLGDAFASGGSQGYDHKAMGITARGAWESVKRHFRELDLNTQSEPFSVIGIGDMSGDVFGNGMLLSPHIKLVGAFNHLHIFLDPDPDPTVSFEERQRLFNLPRSSWMDYKRELISKGGGIYARSAKSIPLSKQVRALLDTPEERMTPNALIRTMLLAPADLLWNGGIGTYVKSSQEQHSDAGDRSNDSVRVSGNELRCRVVGEGGNLGVTQLGRVEFAANGGHINTDAIDNSAGVDCSDHEVNIKILLNEVVANQDMTEKQRNKQLEEMTDEVAELVLYDNYLQTQTLSVALSQASQMVDVHARLMRQMEADGELDRQIEFLPGKEDIDDRILAGQGLTAPELSVLLAYVKIHFFQQLLASSLPCDTFYGNLLIQYFPAPLRKNFSELMPKHRLSCEIISTVVANEVVNRAGITFAFRLKEEIGADAESIARAYTVAREIFSMPSIWSNIEALDNIVSAETQTDMLLEGRKLIERSARWLLRNRPQPIDINANIEHFKPGFETLSEVIPSLLPLTNLEQIEAEVKDLMSKQVPEKLARSIAMFDEFLSLLDIVEVANTLNLAYEQVASVYFSLGEKLQLSWLHTQIVNLPRRNRWEALSRAALRDDLYSQHRMLAQAVLSYNKDENAIDKRVNHWIDKNSTLVNRCQQIITDLKTTGSADLSMLTVAIREIRGMISIEC